MSLPMVSRLFVQRAINSLSNCLPSERHFVGIGPPSSVLRPLSPVPRPIQLISMSNTVISVEHLSKVYRLGQIGTGTLSHDLNVWWAKTRGKPNPLLRIGETERLPSHNGRGSRSMGEGEDLWALRDISFTVEQGEVLGIIGRNGAGKSTLLKILSRITAPTSGKIKVKGRVASLLEIGTGFHPELTGRENIYLNGAILGMSRKEIDRKFDEIVDFAEVEKFIDTPVKRYSSGMYVRLAFAVAAHLDPEILLVDEVLAVGDAEFQKKCLGKMGDIARGGRTVLFVSHNLVAIQKLCSRSVLLLNGRIEKVDNTLDVIQYYLASNALVRSQSKNSAIQSVDQVASQITSWHAISHGENVHSVISGDDMSICFEVEFREKINNVFFGIAIWSEEGILVWAANSHDGNNSTLTYCEGKYQIFFDIKNFSIKSGRYNLEFSINTNNVQLDRWQAYPILEVLASKPTLLSPAWQGIINFTYAFHSESLRSNKK